MLQLLYSVHLVVSFCVWITHRVNLPTKRASIIAGPSLNHKWSALGGRLASTRPLSPYPLPSLVKRISFAIANQEIKMRISVNKWYCEIISSFTNFRSTFRTLSDNYQGDYDYDDDQTSDLIIIINSTPYWTIRWPRKLLPNEHTHDDVANNNSMFWWLSFISKWTLVGGSCSTFLWLSIILLREWFTLPPHHEKVIVGPPE